jgi:hypothetical protein
VGRSPRPSRRRFRSATAPFGQARHPEVGGPERRPEQDPSPGPGPPLAAVEVTAPGWRLGRSAVPRRVEPPDHGLQADCKLSKAGCVARLFGDHGQHQADQNGGAADASHRQTGEFKHGLESWRVAQPWRVCAQSDAGQGKQRQDDRPAVTGGEGARRARRLPRKLREVRIVHPHRSVLHWSPLVFLRSGAPAVALGQWPVGRAHRRGRAIRLAGLEETTQRLLGACQAWITMDPPPNIVVAVASSDAPIWLS